MKRLLIVLICVPICLWGLWKSGRSYLLVAFPPPVSADVVVQFVGPDTVSRNLTAEALVQLGFARLMMVPGTSSLLMLDEQGEWIHFPSGDEQKLFTCPESERIVSVPWMEDTHKELEPAYSRQGF